MRTVSGLLPSAATCRLPAAMAADRAAASSRERTLRIVLDSDNPAPRHARCGATEASRRHERRWFLVFDEIAVAGGFQQRWRQHWSLAQVIGEGERLIDQIPRMTAAQRDLPRCVVLAHEAIDEAAVERQSARLAMVLEDVRELLDAGAFGEHLVVNA